jgi:phosphomannomutase
MTSLMTLTNHDQQNDNQRDGQQSNTKQKVVAPALQPVRVLAFDLDDTLAITKSPLSAAMASSLGELLSMFQICVISGGRWEQFQTQLLDQLHVPPELLTRLHLMPTSGTRYYRYITSEGAWVQQYAEDLTDDEKSTIVRVLTEGAHTLGLWEQSPAGEVIEDRGSQITFSALGQLAVPEDKYAWDPSGEKKQALRDFAAPRLPELDVKTGGSTSVDVTRQGVDKAYGMRRLLEILGLKISDVVFFGDQIQDGGNDSSVRHMGIHCISVRNSEDTEVALRSLLAVLKHGQTPDASPPDSVSRADAPTPSKTIPGPSDPQPVPPMPDPMPQPFPPQPVPPMPDPMPQPFPPQPVPPTPDPMPLPVVRPQQVPPTPDPTPRTWSAVGRAECPN